MLFFKKYYILLLAHILFSAQVSISQADLIARNFINKESKSNFQINKIQKEDRLYIVNLKPTGFIVISEDDISIPILGYSFNNNIDLNRLPNQLKALFEDYNF